MRTLIRNARLISPGWVREGSLLIANGRVFGSDGEGEADEVIDAGGRMVMPGFIDIHSHGADGADVCDGSVESIVHIAERKLKEGVTTWLPTTLTQSAERLLEIAACCAKAMKRTDLCRMPGIHLEGPYINREKAGAQNPEFARLPDPRELEALHQIVPLKVMSLAPELPGALELIRLATNAGIICSAAHTTATFAQIHKAKQTGLKHLTHFGNAMTPLHHREIGAVGAGLSDDDLMIEVICDGVHLSEDMLRLIFKCVAIDRILMITDSVAASWRKEGPMILGGLDAEIRDGIVRLKTGELAGSTLRFNEGLTIACEATGKPVEEIAAATSWNQARSLGLDGFGKLEPGFAADLVMLGDDFSVEGVWVEGKRKL